jgi:hypothetical protein
MGPYKSDYFHPYYQIAKLTLDTAPIMLYNRGVVSSRGILDELTDLIAVLDTHLKLYPV